LPAKPKEKREKRRLSFFSRSFSLYVVFHNVFFPLLSDLESVPNCALRSRHASLPPSMEPEAVAFALRRLWGRARSRLGTSIVIVLNAASTRMSSVASSSSPSQCSAGLASLIASAPLWLTSLVLATALYAAKSVLSSIALSKRRRQRKEMMMIDRRRNQRRSFVGGNNGEEEEDANGAEAAARPASGRYGLLDADDDENDRGSAGYDNDGEEDDYASDPDDSATTLASRKEEEAAAAPLPPPLPNPRNVAGLLFRQASVVSGQKQQQEPVPASPSQERSSSSSSSLHVARLEASPEFKTFLRSRGLTPENAAAARRRLGAYRELRAADPPSFRTLLLSSSSSMSQRISIERGVEAVPLGALELLVDSAAGAGCGALALLWWSRVALSWLSSSSSSGSSSSLPLSGGIPPLLAASTALASAGLASAALLGRPLALSVLSSGSSYWWEFSRGERRGTPSDNMKAALAFSLDAAAFGAGTLGLGCVAGFLARFLAVGAERSSLGEKVAGVRLVKERRYRALASAAE
jgi:hypothetical protein